MADLPDNLPLNTRRFPAVEIEPPYQRATAAPYIARPLFFILTVILLIVALGQLGGRILVANLDRLEPRINALLAEQGVVLNGLDGDWRFFNPLLRVTGGEAPGVRFGAAWAEIDTLESLARNRVVLRNASVRDLQLVVAQDEGGKWSLVGRRPTEMAFDWRTLLWHSDQLATNATVSVQGYNLPVSDLVLRANFSNFGGRHRGAIELASARSCASCELRMQYGVEEAALWFRERNGGAVLQANGFELHDSAAALAGLDYLHIGELDGRLRLRGDLFSGPLRLLDGDLQLRGGEPVTVELLAEGFTRDDGSTARFRIDALQLGGGGGELDVREALANWTVESGLLLKVPQLEVGGITTVVGSMLDPEIPTARWIRRLGMQGQFTTVLASWVPETGFYFGGDFDRVSIKNVGGVPAITDLEGSFAGGAGYLQLRMLDADGRVGFPQLYREERDYSSISGDLLLYFGQDYFGLQGSNLRIVDASMTTQGGFALVSTKPLTENHITLALSSDAGEFADLTAYVPYTLPLDVRDWLAQSGLEAELSAPRFIMHGPLREEESDMGRSYLLEADMRNGSLQFNAEWPRIAEATGLVHVSHTGVIAELEQAELSGLALSDMRLSLPAGEERVIANGLASFEAGAGLAFVRNTPLKTSMDFVADDWWAGGQMQLDVDLDLPLDTRAANGLDSRVGVKIRARLNDTTFGMPEAGLEFTAMRGGLDYSYPYELSGKNIKGSLFGQPMTLAINSAPVAAAPDGQPARFAPRRIDFEIDSALHSDNLWPLLSMTPSSVVEGLFDFSAVYTTETDTGVYPLLNAETELAGAAVNLPAPFGKLLTERALTLIAVEFGAQQQRANLLYRGLLNADIGIAGEGIVGGHMQLLNGRENGVRLARWDGETGPVLIDGALGTADIAEWAGGTGDGAVDLPPYNISGLAIAEVTLGDFVIPDLALSGSSGIDSLTLEFDSATAAGTLVIPDEALTELTLTQFSYLSSDEELSSGEEPSSEEKPSADVVPSSITESAAEAETLAAAETTSVLEVTPDPIDPEMMDSLQDMRVRIDALAVDGEDYGSWQFEIARTEDGVAFKDLVANLKGVDITSEDGVSWTRDSNRTAFAGQLAAGDMGGVLEAWGYARSMESKSMATNADISWSGSPLNFEVLQLRGEIAAGVSTGRFLDVTSGNNAMRIFSLLNFTAIAKRMSLNFKDVFGRGISFEKVEAATRLDDGLLTFTQPMRVEGTGGDFKFNGAIDLRAGTMDSELVVTLPVNKSLPWLGAYLALANPVVGIGVLVGERILRKPIRELSSAKYSVTGAIDDPTLELVNVFDRSMKEVPESAAEVEILDSDSPLTPTEAELPLADPQPPPPTGPADPAEPAITQEIAPDGSLATVPGP